MLPIQYKARNDEFTRKVNEAEQEIVNLETAIERAKRKPQIQSQLQITDAVEFSDDMMACVKQIKVFSKSEIAVEVDLSGIGNLFTKN